MKNLEDGRDDDDDSDGGNYAGPDHNSNNNSASYPAGLSDYRVGLTHRGNTPVSFGGSLVTPESPSKGRYGPVSSSSSSSSASKYNRRVRGGGKIISELESFGVRPSASVATVVNFVDSLTLITGRYVYMSVCVYVCMWMYMDVYLVDLLQ